MYRHVVRCLIAGIVASLPIGGTVLVFIYMESVLSASWLASKAFYFPGLGLLLVVVALYVIGVFVTTFLGRWIWRRLDSGLSRLPLVGGLYQTLKQILGYGGGADAIFQQVVLVPSEDTGGVQIGLVTDRRADGKLAVFLPGSPNPTAGRLVLIEEEGLTALQNPVVDALKTLVSVGKGSTLGVPPPNPQIP